MELDEKLGFIFGRRSIRVYGREPIAKELITRLLQAAMAAPSAVAKDPWRFVIVRRQEQLDRITKVLPHGQMLATAPLGIVVCGDIDVAHDHQVSYMLQDCSAATENLLLCSHLLGLGACWLGVHPREDRMKKIKQILSLPENIIPIACLAIGYPAEFKEPRTRFNPDFVHFESWGSGAQKP